MRDNVSRIAQIFLKFADVKHNWKIQKLKNIFFGKVVGKLACLLDGDVKNFARLLASWHASLKNWQAFGTLAYQVEKLAHLLARWHVKMRS